MERIFICGGSKYLLTPNDTIILPVTIENLPGEIVVEDQKLILQKSFHVSLVCIKEIIRKQGVSIPSFRNLAVQDFCDFVDQNQVDLVNYSNIFRYAERDDLKTVIIMCDISNLNKFFDLMNKKYGLKIEYPPMHVTLYILEDKHGIFLTDSEDIKNLTETITNPIGRLL